MRRMQLDEQRAQIADSAAKTLDRPAEHICLTARSTRRGVVRERGERERETGDLLHRAVMEIRSDSAPLARRRCHRILEQRLSLLVPTLQPAHQRPEERNLDEQDQRDRAEDRRCERLRSRRALAFTDPSRW